MATTFPKFLQLPWELQDCIWKLSVEPRIVKIRRVQVTHTNCVYNEGSVPTYKLVTSMPVPAQVQTCYQARYQHRLYQRVFSELDTVRSGEERQYVWMNLDIDTVDAGIAMWSTLFDYQSVARSIQYLKFEIRWISLEDGAKAALYDLFLNLQELHITVSMESFLERQSATREQLSGYMPRSLKKLVVHTTSDGLTGQWDESVGDDDPQNIRWIRDVVITEEQCSELKSKAMTLKEWKDQMPCTCCPLRWTRSAPVLMLQYARILESGGTGQLNWQHI